MPVKWTPETDQILLLKILETSDISPKCAEISQKWPPDLDRPTPRAISERIFKIRSAAKASGTAGHFSISAPTKSNSGGTARKNANAAVKKTSSKKSIGGKATETGKRKRGGGGEMSDEEASPDPEADPFKSADNGTDASDDEAPAAKKTKTNDSAANGRGKNKKGLVKVEIEEEENKTIHHKGYENAFGEEDGMEVLDAA